MKRLPVGIQTFRDIVQNDYLYVDKTKKIFDLVNNPKGVYFLSRPRRFGKSFLISTLNEIFEGEKELFKDLWIYKADYAWEKYPVVRIDFSKSKARNSDELINYIVYQLDKTAQLYGISLEQTQYDIKFDELLTKLSEINKVIVLIDEYDKPIIIFEFKFNGNKDQALNQIKDKKYFEKYQGVGKEIYLFGVTFTDRNIGDWVLEKL